MESIAAPTQIIDRPNDYELAPAINRLVPFVWKTELLVICAGMLVSFLIAGFSYPYWRIADMDFWIVYNSFLLNAGLPQEYFDHPGYLSILLLSEWMRILHSIGLLTVDKLSLLPPVKDLASFSQAWTAATQAGRVLSLLIAMSFVLAFGSLLRILVRNWRVAALCMFLLAFSGGMAMQMRILPTELLTCGLFFNGLLILLIAARQGSHALRPLLIGLSALLMTLALLNKIQVIFLIFALPFILMFFGPESRGSAFWRGSRFAWAAFATSAAIALCAAYAAKDLVSVGFSTLSTATMTLPQLAIGAPTYWTLFAIWLGAGMAVYTAVWRVPMMEMLASAFGIVAGTMFALLALYLRYHPNNVLVVFHPLEQMWAFGSATAPHLSAGRLLGPVLFFVDALGGVLARHTFVLQSSPRPTIFLEWFVIAATIFAWRRGERRIVLQVAALMLTVYAVDILGMARGLKQEYFLLSDPLVIIAAGLLLVRVETLQHYRWAYPIGVALIVAHVLVSQAEPVKHIFKTDGPEVLCGLYHNAKRVEHLPVCRRLAAS